MKNKIQKILALVAILVAGAPVASMANPLSHDHFLAVKLDQNGYGVGYRVAKVGNIDFSAIALEEDQKIKGGIIATVPIIGNLNLGIGTQYDNTKPNRFGHIRMALALNF